MNLFSSCYLFNSYSRLFLPQFYTPERFFLGSTQRLHCDFPAVLPSPRLVDYLPKDHAQVRTLYYA